MLGPPKIRRIRKPKKPWENQKKQKKNNSGEVLRKRGSSQESLRIVFFFGVFVFLFSQGFFAQKPTPNSPGCPVADLLRDQNHRSIEGGDQWSYTPTPPANLSTGTSTSSWWDPYYIHKSDLQYFTKLNNKPVFVTPSRIGSAPPYTSWVRDRETFQATSPGNEPPRRRKLDPSTHHWLGAWEVRIFKYTTPDHT